MASRQVPGRASRCLANAAMTVVIAAEILTVSLSEIHGVVVQLPASQGRVARTHETARPRADCSYLVELEN